MRHANACITRAQKRRDNTHFPSEQFTFRLDGRDIRERDLERDLMAQAIDAAQVWHPDESPLARERVKRTLRRYGRLS